MKYIGAIDVGTTSTRFIVFDAQGNSIAVAQREHPQIFPRPGWVEHSPLEIWRTTEQVIAEALASRNLTAKDIAAVGVTNQRETAMIWDRRNGEPLYNALVWQDTRTDDLAQRYAVDGGVDRFRAVTGLPLASYFSSLKLKWLLDNAPNARRLAQEGHLLFGTMDTWALWNLTGGGSGGLHITDVTNASRTQLMRLDELCWDADILATLGIPDTLLPRIASSSEVYGEIASGPLKGVPVAGILGDQQAALVGQTCFTPGQAKNTYGTGCFLLLNTGEQAVTSNAGLVTTVAYRFGTAPAHYALEGSIAIGGALVQWLRDNLGIIKSSSEIEALAASVPDNGDVYIVPAFSGLYAPYWKEHARGVITGLTRYANKAHLARATLEAVAFQTRDVVAAMQRDADIALNELRVDGGMVVNELLMQFQSDILDAPVVRPKMVETTALGAAYAAGLACGYWRDIDELRQNWSIDRTYTPAMDSTRRDHLRQRWDKAVQRSFDWVDSLRDPP